MTMVWWQRRRDRLTLVLGLIAFLGSGLADAHIVPEEPWHHTMVLADLALVRLACALEGVGLLLGSADTGIGRVQKGGARRRGVWSGRHGRTMVETSPIDKLFAAAYKINLG